MAQSRAQASLGASAPEPRAAHEAYGRQPRTPCKNRKEYGGSPVKVAVSSNRWFYNAFR